jgi:hypothetical protein
MSEEKYLKRIKELEDKLAFYEQDGGAKLYYSLQRKMNEIADILNNVKLSNLALDDKNDKTFERLKVLWTDSKVISEAVKVLGDSAGVTGNEKKDVERKPFVDTIAESRK